MRSRLSFSDTMVLAKRNLARIPRQPDLLIAYTIQPVMFVLLFVFVFGGAIQTPGFDYVDFLMPGIIVQSLAFGGFVTALGLAEDVKKGLIDRFRSLPMSRGAVLAGRTLSDIALNCVSLVVLFAVGFLAGFNFIDSSVARGRRRDRPAALLGYAFSWIFALIGLYSSSPETANAIGFTLIFPLTFASSIFVPVESMPDGLRQFAEANPFTTISDAVRSLWLGTPAQLRRLDGVRLVHRADRRVRAARHQALPDGRGEVAGPSRPAGAGRFGAMARPGDEVVDPSGLRLVFLETAASSGGAAISLDWFVPPGGRLVALPHVHPFDTEGFEIFAGRARYRVGRRVSEQDAPYAYGVPPGRAARARREHRADPAPRPPDRASDPPDGPLLEGVEQFFETLFALAQRRKVTSAGVILDPLQGAATLSLLLPFSYLPWLPRGFQRVAIGGLARVAQGLGYAAHLEPEWAARGPEPVNGPAAAVA